MDKIDLILNFVKRISHCTIQYLNESNNDKSEISELIAKVTPDYPVVSFTQNHIYTIIKTTDANLLISKNIKNPLQDQSNETLIEGICLIQNFLNNTDIHIVDVMQLNHLFEKQIVRTGVENTSQTFLNLENNVKHNPYDEEIRESDAITVGDDVKLREALAETFDGEYATLAPTKLRSIKNLAIVTLALTARAAIKGGLDYEYSFSLNDSFIRSIENAREIDEIYAIVTAAKFQYTHLVAQNNSDEPEPHLLTKKTKDYIVHHLNQKISVNTIAIKLHVTNNYLSQIFHKCEGITTTDFINLNKIRASQNELIYTSDNISSIAAKYGYTTTSYYGKVFKSINKVTPLAFRNLYGKV